MDRYSANQKAERSLQYDDMSWAKFVQCCETHILFQSNKHAMDLLAEDVSGLVSLSLSQNAGGSLATLRDILAEVIREELSIVHQAPPCGETAKHRKEIYDLFLPMPKNKNRGARSTLLRRYVLGALFNADLSGDLIHYCSWGCCEDLQDSVRKFTLWGTWALMPTKLPKFAKNRWTNQQGAVSWAGLLEAHHQLLSKMVARFTGGPVAPQPQDELQQLVPDDESDNDDAGAAYLQLGNRSAPKEETADEVNPPGEEQRKSQQMMTLQTRCLGNLVH